MTSRSAEIELFLMIATEYSIAMIYAVLQMRLQAGVARWPPHFGTIPGIYVNIGLQRMKDVSRGAHVVFIVRKSQLTRTLKQ